MHYGNALSIIKSLSINKSSSKRKISKKDFLEKLNTKKILFNKWLLEIKSTDKHWKQLKKEHFTNFNLSPFDRFFLLEINDKDTIATILDVIILICKKYSKLSRRETTPFCPYFYLHNITADKLIKLKLKLINSGFKIVDGHSFQGAKFRLEDLLTQPNYGNNIKAKIINKLNDLKSVLKETSNTIEIYQFYLNNEHYQNKDKSIKSISIQIDDLKTIRKII